MGSNGSKTNNGTVITQNNEVDVCGNSDPRSPTPEITRTPLQGKPGAKHNITKNCDLRKTFDMAKTEEKLIHNNPILSAVIKNHLQSYDPRSPTQDFERTPIVISSQADEVQNGKNLIRSKNVSCASPQLNKTDQDENCDSCTEANEISPELIVPKNLCNGFYDLTLNGSIKDTEEPLGSSTASNEAIQENISPELVDYKPTELLETNFDYIEYDEKFEDSCEDAESSGESIKVEEHLKNSSVFKILDIDPRSPSLGIERTPIVVTKIIGDKEDNVEQMSDDSLIKVLQSTNAELRQTGTKMHDNNVDELLVYEDEITDINDTPKKSKPTNSSGPRTPLSCMKNKDGVHARSKSANTLYNPKNQKVALSKIPKRVSHIPRLKSLSKPTEVIPAGSSVSLKNISKASSVGGDCENTPPHSHRDRWDKDSSIVL